MNILLISPPDIPIRPESKYIGIERMVWYYARELIKNHQVTVMGHQDSIYPDGVQLLGIYPEPNHVSELQQYQIYQSHLRKFDVIHDWSHLHLASRYTVKLPSLNLFFHAPALARYPKAPYNIVSFSQWGAREFERVYGQKARYQQSIGIDPKVYKISQRHRNDRFLALARMGPEKGNLEAAVLCSTLKVPLDIISARGAELTGKPHTDYEKEVLSFCDGKQIRIFEDSVPEPEKIKYLQTCKALIYCTDHPEVTSHKLQEAMFCGAPVIAPVLGAMSEIVTDKVNGFLCNRHDGYLWAMQHIDELSPKKAYAALLDKYSIEKVVERYIPLYESVALGERW